MSKMKTNDKQYRQGDVMVDGTAKIDSLPDGSREIPHDGKRLVLMHGELTGHAHAFYQPDQVKLYQAPNGERFLRVVGFDVPLTHEEHTQAEIPQGLYRLPVQTEWTDENEPLQVQD